MAYWITSVQDMLTFAGITPSHLSYFLKAFTSFECVLSNVLYAPRDNHSFQPGASLKSGFPDLLDALRDGYTSQRVAVHERFFADADDRTGNIDMPEQAAPEERTRFDSREPFRDRDRPEPVTQEERECPQLPELSGQLHRFQRLTALKGPLTDKGDAVRDGQLGQVPAIGQRIGFDPLYAVGDRQ